MKYDYTWCLRMRAPPSQPLWEIMKFSAIANLKVP